MADLQQTVDSWLKANPTATNNQVASAVQSVGGLDANAGLAGILASRYGIDPSEVQNYYNNFAATNTAAPVNTAAVAPVNAVASAPVNTAVVAPTNTIAAAPVNTVAPVNTMSAAPVTQPTLTNTVVAPVNTAAAPAKKPYRPSLGEWMSKSGLDFNTAADLYNGVVGSNKDTRDWTAIMAAEDPVAAARRATYNMYGGVTERTVTDPDTGKPYQMLFAADGTRLTMPSNRKANFGLEGTWLDNLTKKSTPEQVAQAYRDFLNSDLSVQGFNPATGLNSIPNDSKQNQDEAIRKLQKRGISTEMIENAYKEYLKNPSLTGSEPLSQGLNKGSTADQVSAAYEQFVTNAGGDTKKNRDEAARFLTSLGVDAPIIDDAYDKFLMPLQSLTKTSTPEEIARAYYTITGGKGGDTQESQDRASKLLEGLGVEAPTITGAYDDYKDLAGLRSNFGAKDSNGLPTMDGILSGFKYAKDNDIKFSDMERVLGKDDFNKYKANFSDYAKTGIANIIADNKLSFDEASMSKKFAREYGLDAQGMADLTGQKKELFDAIDKTYTESGDRVIKSALNADDAKTAGDKIVKGLALQQKYGFTDEDLSRATGIPLEELTGYLEPTRNFATTYKETMSKPDVTGKDILSLLEKSKDDPGVRTAYGTNIDGQIAKLKELDQKWGKYGLDGYQAENISNQLGKITDAAGGKNWSGEWMGGGENAKLQATALLMRKGVDNLADLGVRKRTQQFDSNVDFYEGQNVRKDDEGRKYIYEKTASGDAETSTRKYLPKDAKTTPGIVERDDEDLPIYRPLSEKELATYDPKTGKFDAETSISDLIDKSTGKVIASNQSLGVGSFFGKSGAGGNRFTLDSYDTGNFFKGSDKEFGIMMTDEGVPVPYQTTEKDGFMYSPAFPIMMAMIAPGISNAISGSLSGAATAATGAAELGFTAGTAPTLMNTALTQGIMGGGMAALTGQDVLKGALLGGIGAPISAGIGSFLPSGLDANATRAITNAGTGVAKGLLQGGDFEDLLGQGVLSGLVNYGSGELSKNLGGSFNLTPQQLNLATGVLTPLLQGKKLDPMNVYSMLAQNAQQQTKKATP